MAHGGFRLLDRVGDKVDLAADHLSVVRHHTVHKRGKAANSGVDILLDKAGHAVDAFFDLLLDLFRGLFRGVFRNFIQILQQIPGGGGHLLGGGDDALRLGFQGFGQTGQGFQLVFEQLDLAGGELLRNVGGAGHHVDDPLGFVVNGFYFGQGVRGRLFGGLFQGLFQGVLHAVLEGFGVKGQAGHAVLDGFQHQAGHFILQIEHDILAQIGGHLSEIRFQHGVDGVAQPSGQGFHIGLDLLELFKMLFQGGNIGDRGHIRQVGQGVQLGQVGQRLDLGDAVHQIVIILPQVLGQHVFADVQADVLDGKQRFLQLGDHVVDPAHGGFHLFHRRIDDLDGSHQLGEIQQLVGQAAAFDGLHQLQRILAHSRFQDLVQAVLHHVGNVVEHVGGGVDVVGQQVGDLAEAAHGEQRFAEAVFVRQHAAGDVLCNARHHAGDAAGHVQHRVVLGQAQLIHEGIEKIVQRLFQLQLQGGLFLVPVAVFFFLFRFLFFLFLAFQHFGAHVNIPVGLDADASADAGDIVDIHDVDGYGHAHAHAAVGGGAVGLNFGHRAVAGDGMNGTVHILLVDFFAVLHVLAVGSGSAHGNEGRVAVDGGVGGVILNIQHKAGGHGHAAFAGFRLLAAAVLFQHAPGADVLAAVDAAQARAARDGLIGLLVGAALIFVLFFVLLIVVLARALGAGHGNALQGADRISAHKDAVADHAVLERCFGAVVQNGDIEGGRHSRVAAGGGTLGRGGMLRFVGSVDHGGLQFLRVAQIVLAAQGERVAVHSAQIRHGAAAGDIQGQNRHDGDAARAARLGDDGVLHLLLGDETDIVQGRVLVGHGEFHAVLHGGGGVRAGDGHGNARAHAHGFGGFLALGVALGAEVYVGVGGHFKVAAA